MYLLVLLLLLVSDTGVNVHTTDVLQRFQIRCTNTKLRS